MITGSVLKHLHKKGDKYHLVYRDFHINVSEDVNLSTQRIRSSRLNSCSTINYSSLSGVAIIGQRDEGGGGGSARRAAGTQHLLLERGL